MGRQPISPRLLLALIGVGVVLPIAITVIAGVAAIMGGMGDAGGSRVLGYVASAAGIVWAIDLACLVLAHALNAVSDSDGPHHPPQE